MAKAMTMMRSVLMPMSLAVSGSCAVACMARPVRVLATKKPRAIMQTGAAMRRKRSPRWTVAPRMSKASPLNWGKARAFLASGYQLQIGLLEGDGEADGGDEGGEAWGAAQRAVGEAFRCDADEDGHDDAAEEHERQGERQGGAGGQREEDA